MIAEVPGAFLLSVGTFVLSVRGRWARCAAVAAAAAVWLYLQGETGWAIFMVVWGAVVISSIDNFVKPLLIARGSTLSLALIFLGVLGGVIAFGFIGVILGPVLLALGMALGRKWNQRARSGDSGSDRRGPGRGNDPCDRTDRFDAESALTARCGPTRAGSARGSASVRRSTRRCQRAPHAGSSSRTSGALRAASGARVPSVC